jgi:4-hydroxythreonine-4-phosphate dehydrogenase
VIRLAITPGEPAGIGPDLIIKLAQRPNAAELVVYADPELLLARARELNLPLRLRQLSTEMPPSPLAAGEFN